MSSKRNKKGNSSGGSRLFSASPSPSPSGPRTRSGTPYSDDEDAASSASRTPSKRSPLTHAVAQHEGDITTRSQETTWHRRVRDLCRDHLKTLQVWEVVVQEDLAKAVADVCTAAGSLDDALQLPSSTLPTRDKSIASALQDLSSDIQDLQDLLPRLDKLSKKLDSINNNAQKLLADALESKGASFVTAAQWNTWSLDDLVSAVQAQSSSYIVQSAHLKILSRLLIRRGCATGFSYAFSDSEHAGSDLEEAGGAQSREDDASSVETGSSDSASNATPSASSASETASESGSSGRSSQASSASPGRKATTRSSTSNRASVRARVMEEWQLLPYLGNAACLNSSDMDRQLLEEICSVEIGRWNEER